MKKLIALILLSLSLITLIACANDHEDTPTFCYPGDTDKIFDSQPKLNLICGNEQIETWGGISGTWRYQSGDGTWMAICADRMHVLQAKEYITPFLLVDERTVYMQWEVTPDKLYINCWNEDAWGNVTASCENISFDAEKGYRFELKDGNYIYEIVAEWNRFEKWNGTADYSFYTVKS